MLNRTIWPVVLFLFNFTFGFSKAADIEADIYHVGMAEVNITPKHPIRLNGFGGRRAESEGINHLIFARALSIRHSDDAEPILLMTVDVLGIPDTIRDELAKRLKGKIASERIAISATHTHCGPMLKGANPTLFGVPIPDEHLNHIDSYTAEFVNHLEEVALAALKNPQAAKLYWDVGQVDFAMNRRTRGGPTDHDLPVLVVKDAKTNQVRAVYASYACHCVTLSHNKIGGDWAGYAAEAIRNQFPGSVAMIAIGCGADQNPGSGVTGDKVETAQLQGRQIASEVKRMIGGYLMPVRGKPVCTMTAVELPLSDLPTRTAWEEKAKKNDAIGHHARVQLAKLDRRETLQTKINYPIQTISFGQSLAMVHLPGEVVVDYSTRLKSELDRRRVWINSYTNNNPCYIPSERILKEGGYEGGGAMVYYDVPVPFRSGLEETIVRTVKNQIGKQYSSPFDASKTNGSKPLSPQQSLKTIRTESQFVVDLVAAEPLVSDPVAMAFGPDGKLWVVEMLDYPAGKTGSFEPGGRIRYLEDTNGDGIFDQATTFLEGIPFPTGILPWRNGVLITAAPDILYAEATKGAGKADIVKKLFSGFGTENYQARVNGLSYGLDGWVYGSCGLFGGKILSHLTGKTIELGDRDFRIKPDTGAIEPVTGRTQQGLTRNDWGDWLGCDNSNLGRHYVLAEEYLSRNPFVAPPNLSVSIPTGADPNRLFPTVIPQLFALSGPAGRTTAACGINVYRDDRLGKDFTGNTFICEPVNLLVHRRVVKPNGVTFQGERAQSEMKSEFLTSSDTWFRPVQVTTGPDGGLWIADMYRFVIEHPRWIPPTDLAKLDVRAGAGLGRIYRVRRKEEPILSLPKLNTLDTAGLVAALDTANGWQRDLATEMLIWQAKADAVPLLQKSATESKRAETRLHSLVALARLNAMTPEVTARAMSDEHPGVRRHAVRLSEPFLNSNSELAAKLPLLADDPDPMVRLQVAYTLGFWDDPNAGNLLAKIVQKDGKDQFILAAVVSSLNRKNFQMFVHHPEIAKRANTTLLPKLIATAIGLQDDSVMSSLLTTVTQTNIQSYQVWQFTALESVLEAWNRVSKGKKLPESVTAMLKSARLIAADAKADSKLRIAATKILGRMPDQVPDDISLLSTLLAPQIPAGVQSAAVSALARLSNDHAAEVLVKEWSNYSPAMQAQVIDVLLDRDAWIPRVLTAISKGTIPASVIPAGERQGLLTHPDLNLRKQAEKAFAGALNQDRQLVINNYRQSLPKNGNATVGKEVFNRVCATCHRLNDVGYAVGPDLAALANKSPEYLLAEILDPNRNLDNRYLEYRAHTIDGRSFNGLLASESSAAVTLRSAEGKETTFLRTDLDSLKSSGRSLMPEGLEKDVTPEKMADLIAYLSSIRTPAKSVSGNTPLTVRESDGTLTLRAANCEIHGDQITFEPDFGNIGYWHGSKDHIVWHYEIETAGEYDVYLDAACEASASGNVFSIDFPNGSLAGQTVSTGGWSQYKWSKIGTHRLNAVAGTITVRPNQSSLRGALMDLRTIYLIPKGQQPKFPSAKAESPKSDDAKDLAAFILDDSKPEADREAIISKYPQHAAVLVQAMAKELPTGKEEYRRIPWIWRVAIAAGKRNQSKELTAILDVALPQKDQPFRDWHAVVIGGGIINGISMEHGWPLPIIEAILKSNSELKTRWTTMMAAAIKMAVDESTPTGTRYDALRIAALSNGKSTVQQLAIYLKKGVHEELQMGAVSGFVDIDSPDATQALINALTYLSGENRTLALNGLIRDEMRITALLNAVENGQIKPESIREIAKQLKKHSSESIRTKATKLIGP